MARLRRGGAERLVLLHSMALVGQSLIMPPPPPAVRRPVLARRAGLAMPGYGRGRAGERRV